MHRRYFEFVYKEICVSLAHRISRYDLWLRLWESGADPDELTPNQIHDFIESGLEPVLLEEGGDLSPRERTRLEKRLMQFDPRFPTPEEWLSRSILNASEAG